MLFQAKLVLKKLSKKSLTYSISLKFKILSSGISLILLLFILFNNYNHPKDIILSNLIPITLFLLSLLSALYHEKWIFNKNENVVVYQFGLVFACKSKTIRFQDIKHLELKSFTRGKDKKIARNSTNFFEKRICLLGLRMKNEKLLKVEFFNKNTKMETTARTIADFCELPIVSE